jgi:hypothetical protein
MLVTQDPKQKSRLLANGGAKCLVSQKGNYLNRFVVDERRIMRRTRRRLLLKV